MISTLLASTLSGLAALQVVNSAAPPVLPPDPQRPASPPAAAQPTAPQVPPDILQRFAACTDMIRTEPERAVEAANVWLVNNGGMFARQCLGLAYVAQERWAPAATVYEQAARDAQTVNDARRADFWVQAGNAWIAGGEPTRAVMAFDEALAAGSVADELRGEIHLDRARALVALNNAAGARTDIDRAIQLVPADPFAWYLSAELHRRAGDLPRANSDILQALERASDNPDITLLAGTIAGQMGDMGRAEQLYRRVAEQAPDTEAGRAARASLETARDVEEETPAATPPRPAPADPQSR